jgi:regulator of protease activity HflC (stomatin/prohibitin superfamily)
LEQIRRLVLFLCALVKEESSAHVMGILQSYFLEAPDSFRTFVSVQQEHFRFGSSCDGHSTTFLTADNVGLHVEATMFYRITDVRTAFSTSISTIKDLNETLRSQAMSSLMAI